MFCGSAVHGLEWVGSGWPSIGRAFEQRRIGQGIEFDYCCVHGVLAAKEMGYETIMINCNNGIIAWSGMTGHRVGATWRWYGRSARNPA